MLFEFNHPPVSAQFEACKINRPQADGTIMRELDTAFRSGEESTARETLELPPSVRASLKADFAADLHVPRKWLVLRYKAGDFFLPHVDKDLGTRATKYGQQRHVEARATPVARDS